MAALVLATISVSATSITATTPPATFGATWTAGADGLVYLAVTLSALNGAAATITPRIVRTRSSVATNLDFARFSMTKEVATETTSALLIGPIDVLTGDVLQLRLNSTNSSDTVVTGVIKVYDGTSADVRSIAGTSQTAGDLGAGVNVAFWGGTGVATAVVRSDVRQIAGNAIQFAAADLTTAKLATIPVTGTLITTATIAGSLFVDGSAYKLDVRNVNANMPSYLGEVRLAQGYSGDLVATSTALATLASSFAAGVTLADGAITAAKLASDALVAIANKVESEIIDETDNEKVLTAITNKIASVNPSLAGLSVATIAAASRDAMLNAVLAGNFDIAGTLGKLIQKLNVAGALANAADADTYKATGFATPSDVTNATNALATSFATSLGTLTTSISTMGGNVDAILAMTTGTGANRAFTATALANTPASIGGDTPNFTFEDEEVQLA